MFAEGKGGGTDVDTSLPCEESAFLGESVLIYVMKAAFGISPTTGLGFHEHVTDEQHAAARVDAK